MQVPGRVRHQQGGRSARSALGFESFSEVGDEGLQRTERPRGGTSPQRSSSRTSGDRADHLAATGHDEGRGSRSNRTHDRSCAHAGTPDLKETAELHRTKFNLVAMTRRIDKPAGENLVTGPVRFPSPAPQARPSPLGALRSRAQTVFSGGTAPTPRSTPSPSPVGRFAPIKLRLCLLGLSPQTPNRGATAPRTPRPWPAWVGYLVAPSRIWVARKPPNAPNHDGLSDTSQEYRRQLRGDLATT